MLSKLLTELGERSTYDAVSQCSRCGFCEQACPTYVATGKEAFSARGRNQLVRMLIEGKLADPDSAREALETCLLCGACATICPAHVPTAEIVLEGRRMLRAGVSPWPARLLAHLLARRPGALAAGLRWAYRFKRWGLDRLLAGTRLLRLAGLRGLEEASGHVDEAPRRFLFEELANLPELSAVPQNPAWGYFAPCGPNYLFPRVGLATVRLLGRLLGPGRSLKNTCCGLLSFNYGDESSAREMARAVVSACEDGGEAPVIGDCSSCVAFLKSYPQLFLGEPEWRARAERFARRVKDVVECVPPDKIPLRTAGLAVTYHDACRAKNGQGLSEEPRRGVKAAAGGAYRELPEADVCCGGAGAFAFLHPELSDDLLRRKTANIASTHARTVAVSSTSCLIQLARGLKKYYPECRVVHFSELMLEALPTAPENP